MIGSIKERTVSNVKPPAPPTPPRAAGFPRAEHRSKKSSFLRHREELSSEADARDAQLPTSPPSSLDAHQSPRTVSGEDDASAQGKMPDEISGQNAKIIESMTDEEREQNRQEIVERFGLDIGERLQRARAAQRRVAAEGEQESPLISGLQTSLTTLLLSAAPKKSPDTPEPSTPEMPVKTLLGNLRGAIILINDGMLN